MDSKAIATQASFIDERVVAVPAAVDSDKGVARTEMLLKQYSRHEPEHEYMYLQEYGLNSHTEMSSRLGIVDYRSNSILYSDVDADWVLILRNILELVPAIESGSRGENCLHDDAVEIFLRPFEHYIARELRLDIDRAASQFNRIRFDAEFVKNFCEPPRDELRMLVTQTLILELHVAKYEHDLDDSPYTLSDFTSRMSTRSFYESFFAEYATLGRRLVMRVCSVLRSRRELLQRLLADESSIVELYLREPFALTGVSFSVGDKHNGGRSVSVVYSDGGGFVYKPRPMQVESVFFEFVAQMSCDLDISLKVPKCYCGVGYGWQEYIDYCPVDGHFAFAQFYEELGVLLAAAYVFGLTDLHHENIVAHEAHPVLIDAETLFAPQVERASRIKPPGILKRSAKSRTFNCLNTGILPTDQNDGCAHVWGAAHSEGVRTSFDVPILPAVDRIDPEIRYDRVLIGTERNAPYYGSETANWADYESQIIKGFTLAYRYVCDHKSTLVGQSGYIKKMDGTVVRVVLKGTMVYSVLLMTSNHPDYMREGTEVERLFSYVWQYPSLADSRIWFSELKQMRRLDIPYFTASFSGTNILDADGMHVGNLQQDLSSWWSEHVDRLDEEDLEKQLWFIRASYVTSVAGENYELDKPDRNRPFRLHCPDNSKTGMPTTTDTHASDACRQIVRRLCQNAILGTDGGWYSITVVGNEKWSVQPVAMDFYNGTAGIGYALLYSGYVLNDAQAWETGTSLAGQVAAFLNSAATSILEVGSSEEHPPYNDIGLYGAIGGGMYFLSHAIAMIGDDNGTYRESISAILKALVTRRPDREYLDIVSGSAGLIEALRSVHVVMPELEEYVSALADMHARRLCSLAILSRTGECSWQQDHMGKNALVGYSHGASGIICALADAAAMCGTDDYHRFIDGGLLFERRWRSDLGFWPDLREEFSSSQKAPGMISWCHGAPGVALARLQLMENGYSSDLIPEFDVVADMLDAVEETVVRSILRNGSHFSTSMALCHGLLGSLEILARISRCGKVREGVSSDSCAKEHLQRVNSYWRSVVSEAYENGVICGVPRGLEVPGLMTGLSGIGMSLMRYGAGRWDLPLVLCADVPNMESFE